MMTTREEIRAILAAKKPNWPIRLLKILFNSLMFVLVVWATCIVVGALGFYMIERDATGVSLLDSFYWATQIATTTGPGDVAPKTDWGKLLFMVYNFTVSVGLLLLLGANIIMRVLREANILTHEEQEWTFHVLEQNYAMLAWNVQVNHALATRMQLPLPPLLDGQNPTTGEMPPCPPQAKDTDEEV